MMMFELLLCMGLWCGAATEVDVFADRGPLPKHVHLAVQFHATASFDVEEWRPLVATYFKPEDVDRALCLIGYESLGDPNAYNNSSGASGLFQHLPKYWAERSTDAGWSGADIMDPEANVAVAAWLREEGWQHWSPYNRGQCR